MGHAEGQPSRARTTLSVAWVAQRLSMGSRAHLAWLLKGRKTNKPTQPERPGRTLIAMGSRPDYPEVHDRISSRTSS